MQTKPSGEPRLASIASWAVLAASFGLSAATWIALAQLAGFGGSASLPLVVATPTVRLEWLMPIAVDGYLVVALVLWLSPVPARVARFARTNTYGAAFIGIAAQSAYHALTVHQQVPDQLWRAWLAAVVGALPPAVAALAVHMRALIRREATQPAAEATHLRAEAIQPAAEAIQPAAEAIQPAAEAIQPAAEAIQPAAEATHPVAEAIQPAAEATQPAAEATHPVAEATHPVAEATHPVAEATQPRTEATHPVAEATQPRTEATQPAAEATHPRTEATQPAAEATQPRLTDDRIAEVIRPYVTASRAAGVQPVQRELVRLVASATGQTIGQRRAWRIAGELDDASPTPNRVNGSASMINK